MLYILKSLSLLYFTFFRWVNKIRAIKYYLRKYIRYKIIIAAKRSIWKVSNDKKMEKKVIKVVEIKKNFKLL